MNAVDATIRERANRLRATELFAGVDAAAIDELAKHCRARVLRAGQTLPREEDGNKYFVYVWTGELLVVRSVPERIIYINVPAGGLNRLASSMSASPEAYELEANQEASVLLIPGARVRDMFTRYPSIPEHLIRTLVQRINLATDALCRFRVRDPEDRVLQALRAIEAVRGLELDGTVTMLAEHVGLRRETVSRALQSLGAKGRIKRQGPSVIAVVDEPSPPAPLSKEEEGEF